MEGANFPCLLSLSVITAMFIGEPGLADTAVSPNPNVLDFIGAKDGVGGVDN